MDAMTYSYNSFRQEDEERICNGPYLYEPSTYPTNGPMFSHQELHGFETVHQNIYQNDMCMSEEQQCWEQTPQLTKSGHQAGLASEYTGYAQPDQYYGEFPLDPNMVYINTPDLYSTASDQFAVSCQASPIYAPGQFNTIHDTYTDYSHPVSPITPSGSPPHYDMGLNHLQAAYLLVPTPQYNNTFQSQMGYVSSDAAPSTDSPHHLFELQEDQEEETEEDVLPHHGNRELRGMGLYDDTPDLMFDDSSCSPGGYSPMLGKGLVLERSFGLPEEMAEED